MPSLGDLIRYLDEHATDSPLVRKDGKGPIRTIRWVKFRTLQAGGNVVPSKLLELFSRISTSAAPYDAATIKTRVNDETFGAMRQIHSNQPAWLPSLEAEDLSRYDDKSGGSRKTAFNHYVVSFKRQTNGNGGGNRATGYIEYTAGDETLYSPEPEVRGRVVFDYINGRLFFSPLHYNSWRFIHGEPVRIAASEPAFTADRPNAFYWITDITSFHQPVLA